MTDRHATARRHALIRLAKERVATYRRWYAEELPGTYSQLASNRAKNRLMEAFPVRYKELYQDELDRYDAEAAGRSVDPVDDGLTVELLRRLGRRRDHDVLIIYCRQRRAGARLSDAVQAVVSAGLLVAPSGYTISRYERWYRVVCTELGWEYSRQLPAFTDYGHNRYGRVPGHD